MFTYFNLKTQFSIIYFVKEAYNTLVSTEISALHSDFEWMNGVLGSHKIKIKAVLPPYIFRICSEMLKDQLKCDTNGNLAISCYLTKHLTSQFKASINM